MRELLIRRLGLLWILMFLSGVSGCDHERKKQSILQRIESEKVEVKKTVEAGQQYAPEQEGEPDSKDSGLPFEPQGSAPSVGQ